MASDVGVILVGYLLGSIPFAFLVTKALTGKDIRLEGEGNVGTRNALHVAGTLPGFLVMVLDGGKGAAACWAADSWTSGRLAFYLTAVALMLGHGFPVWLGWRGGKGLAPATGFLLQMWPRAALVAALVYLLAGQVITGFSLAFGVASAVFLLLTVWEGNRPEGLAFIVVLLGLAGVKKAIDLPYERAVQSRSGWVEEPAGVRWWRRTRAR
jgi:glycerol-3-phosphate acyltransferase PlsY